MTCSPTSFAKQRGWLLTVLAVAALAVLCLWAASASALTDSEELGKFGSGGQGAGQLSTPRASAADPLTGHLSVIDVENGRIDEFTPWGEFVKAFGWDVAPGPVNETQEVRIRAAAGTFKLGFAGQETPDLPFDATAEEVQTALNGLASIGGAGGSVTVTALLGKAATATPYIFLVAFKGSLAGTDVAQLAAANGTAPLSGGNPKTALEARTRNDGGAAGTALESCTVESGCRQGSVGFGAGQLSSPYSIAIDAAGSLYLAERDGERVQKFSPGGHFIWMIGGQVDKTQVKKREEEEAHSEPVTVTAAQENLCTAASGDECGAGVAGMGPGQFASVNWGLSVAIAPDGSILVASAGRVQRFDAAGEYQSRLEVPGTENGIPSFAVDPSGGDLYLVYPGSVKNVHKLNPLSGAEIGNLKVERPLALATDPAGNVFVDAAAAQNGDEEGDALTGPYERVIEFDPDGDRISVLAESELIVPQPLAGPGRYSLGGLGGNALGDLYVSYSGGGGHAAFLRIFGPTPISLETPPLRAPQIAAQFAVSVSTSEAELRAKINPRFWNDTTYRLEYGTAPCETGGCNSEIAPRKLTSQVTGAALATGGVLLEGLQPDTTYHYRFVAQSGGGGPVWGVDPDGPEGPEEASPEAGLEGAFTTYREPKAEPCPRNEAFRGGTAALLPDCRAYEMVSPLDKEGGGITVLGSSPTLLPTVLSQAATDGGRLAYGSYRSFGGAKSASWTTQYIAARRAGVGWESHPISPPRGKTLVPVLEQSQAEFQAFSPDLCQGWLQTVAEPPLAPEAPEGNVDLYRRGDEECGGPEYTALNTTAATGGLNMELQGLSGDGATAIFLANRVLAAGGSSGQVQLYGSEGGEEKLLCILPGGGAFAKACTAGAGWSPGISLDSQEDQVANALSTDGQRVYWTAAGEGPGKIYLRENPFGEGSECAGEGTPCTLEVSKAAEEEAGTKGAQFWAAAEDGSKAIFTTGTSEEGKEPKLYEYRLADKSTHPIAAKVLGVMGAGEDASRVYFASREALGGPNGEGNSAVAGEANLYLYEAGEPGSFRFIGALAGRDLVPPSPIHGNLQYHVARVSADGQSAAFSSFAQLTGYDNTDRNSEQADAELFVYDARGDGGKGRLVCASCNPSGARPAGQEFKLGSVLSTGPWTAARIPVPENVLYASRVLSSDGRRLFFDSYDTLSPRDTNGREDVYQWEAPGEGRCEESSPTYSARNGGCVDLISSGKSEADSEFLDASPSGSDVFFTTPSSLVPQDYGLTDAYDARIDGGLPEPPPPAPQCEGEACQPPPQAPADAAPASSSFEGAGNVVKARARHKKHRAKKHRHKHKRADRNARTKR